MSECSSFDGNKDGAVTIDELIAAVNMVLGGCPQAGGQIALTKEVPE